MIKFAKQKSSAAEALMKAIKGGNQTEIKNAWNEFQNAIVEDVKSKFEVIKEEKDSEILAARGFRQLLSKEKNFYQKMIESAKTSNPKQAFEDLLATEGGMPETIYEDVFKDLKEGHPLLSKINFKSVKYLTHWLLSNQGENAAIWGKINAEIKKQIEGAFKDVALTQGKLSAFIFLNKDMLDLGPEFLDAYVRETLKEAIALGLEYGIINGIGVNGEPVGLIRDISKDVNINQETGYPEKEAIKVNNFMPQKYGELVARLAKSENGKTRTFEKVDFICNPIDYFKKIMPATTVLTNQGTYAHDLFPVPTEVSQSVAIPEGKAVICLLDRYFFGLGSAKEGNIECSEEYKFLEDLVTYKAKLYGAGIAEDNTVALVLDISELDPAFITVMNISGNSNNPTTGQSDQIPTV